MPLVQAFQGDPSQAPPQLWNRRLGINPASSLWKRLGRALWWQAWSGDGQAYLVIPAWLWSDQPPSGVSARRLDGLVVISADALNQQQLQQQLASASGARSTAPLQAACIRKLDSSPAVYWQPEALARLSGALSPLLQQARYGCLSLRLHNESLQWQGWAGRRSFAGAPSNLALMESFAMPELSSSKDPSPLLSVQGQQLGLLFNALASREIIREPLEQYYGFAQPEREQILKAPFHLRLVPQAEGAYQAGLQLQISLPHKSQAMQRSLKVLSGRLRDQGLRVSKPSATSWIDPQGTSRQVVGGWLWIAPKTDESVLSVGLGLSPAATVFTGPKANPNKDLTLSLSVNPRDLAERGLLSGTWPRVVRQTPRLQLTLKSMGGVSSSATDWMELRGQLALAAAGES
ncbi:hypothetical protein [Synechococcus sp. RS9916]|uniref:hypothetical protein n=1 Tax=Synechococcus sp. RS9916 TaxID=221359 RepID=UPI001E5DE038|nr:hypothetical protein [Synechococcus sp. RS9916]